MAKPYKPIVCLDFDGVIHSYRSGWKGATVIPDPPVDGALEFLVSALDHFRVAILSSRSHQWGGRRAMKRWLRTELRKLAWDYETTPDWLRERILRHAFADPWWDDVRWETQKIVKEIEWPLFKPAAVITIDDRALTFNGDWRDYTPEMIRAFRPWNKRADKIEVPGQPFDFAAFNALRKASP